MVSAFVYIFDIVSLRATEFEKPKIGISGKRIIENINFQSEWKIDLYTGSPGSFTK